MRENINREPLHIWILINYSIVFLLCKWKSSIIKACTDLFYLLLEPPPPLSLLLVLFFSVFPPTWFPSYLFLRISLLFFLSHGATPLPWDLLPSSPAMHFGCNWTLITTQFSSQLINNSHVYNRWHLLLVSITPLLILFLGDKREKKLTKTIIYIGVYISTNQAGTL